MRTKTMLAAAAALAAGLATSMAQSNVYSVNVVGYVNKVLAGNAKYTAVANPLNTTNNTLAGIFGGAGVGLPTGSQVLKWSSGAGDFTIYGKVAFGSGWTGGGATVSINPGEGCLIRTPSGGSNYTNTFVGEVLQGALTNSLATGYQMIGNKVPDSGPVTTLGFAPPNGSQLLKWDGVAQDWVVYGKVAFGSGWTPSVPSVDVAEGFLVNANAPYNWVRNFTVGP
jgi:hypothetical protein